MKNPTLRGRSLRTLLTDLIIYSNLAFTFIFFSAAFDKGCSSSTAGNYKSNGIANAQKAKTLSELSEKGQTKTAAVLTSVK
ncbi:MAG: hypothetical protein EKK37_06520 [Sphingobacteriales bacterium]|nr:MAG: hypothetical protein EKK37_06520 [Sphingobacteriales bacterium]